MAEQLDEPLFNSFQSDGVSTDVKSAAAQSSAEAILANHERVNIQEQDKVRSNCCMCIHKGEKEFKVLDAKGGQLFVIVENTDNFCTGFGCLCERDFWLHVRFNSEDSDNLANIYMHRQFCSWFSCAESCRRRMTVKDDKKEEILGSIADNFLICPCWPEFTVNDEKGEQRFKVEEKANLCGHLAMCGASSRYCCGVKCYVPSVLAISAEGKKMTKMEHGDSTAEGKHTDSYNVTFPEGSTPRDKLLLISAAIMVDYKMFHGTEGDKLAPEVEAMMDHRFEA